MTIHEAIVAEICRVQSGILPIRTLMRIQPGMMKRLSVTQGLGVSRAHRFVNLGLVHVWDRPSAEGRRTWRTVAPTQRTAVYEALCREASRQANLSWLETEHGIFTGFSHLEWRKEWIERRDAFRRALLNRPPADMPPAALIDEAPVSAQAY
jgi:hypothetical protein